MFDNSLPLKVAFKIDISPCLLLIYVY